MNERNKTITALRCLAQIQVQNPSEFERIPKEILFSVTSADLNRKKTIVDYAMRELRGTFHQDALRLNHQPSTILYEFD